VIVSCAKKVQEVVIVQEREVRGQAFIVTKGRENIKLGLMGIHLLNDEEFTALSRTVIESWEHRDLESRQSKAQYSSDIKLLDKALADKPESPASRQKGDFPQLDQYDDLYLGLQRKRGELARENGKISYASFDDLLSSIGRSLPAAITKTDADGRFAISIDSPVWVIASAERVTPEKTEKYFWAEWCEPLSDGGALSVFLSNDNLISSVSEFADLSDHFVERTTLKPPLPRTELVEEMKSTLAVMGGLLSEQANAIDAKVAAEKDESKWLRVTVKEDSYTLIYRDGDNPEVEFVIREESVWYSAGTEIQEAIAAKEERIKKIKRGKYFSSDEKKFRSPEWVAHNNEILAIQTDIDKLKRVPPRRKSHFVKMGTKFGAHPGHEKRYTITKLQKKEGSGNEDPHELTIFDSVTEQSFQLKYRQPHVVKTHYAFFNSAHDPEMNLSQVKIGETFTSSIAPGMTYELLEFLPSGGAKIRRKGPAGVPAKEIVIEGQNTP
jgi:hypothetical protein